MVAKTKCIMCFGKKVTTSLDFFLPSSIFLVLKKKPELQTGLQNTRYRHTQGVSVSCTEYFVAIKNHSVSGQGRSGHNGNQHKT